MTHAEREFFSLVIELELERFMKTFMRRSMKKTAVDSANFDSFSFASLGCCTNRLLAVNIHCGVNSCVQNKINITTFKRTHFPTKRNVQSM